jgi:WD40 repeat protein
MLAGYDGRIVIKNVYRSTISYQRIKLENGLAYKCQHLKFNGKNQGMLFQLNSFDFLEKNKMNQNVIVTGGADGVINFWDINKKIRTIDLHLDGK